MMIVMEIGEERGGKISLEVEDGVDLMKEDVKRVEGREIVVGVVTVKGMHPIHPMDPNSVEDAPTVIHVRRVQGIVTDEEKIRGDNQGRLTVGIEVLAGAEAEVTVQVVKVEIVTQLKEMKIVSIPRNAGEIGVRAEVMEEVKKKNQYRLIHFFLNRMRVEVIMIGRVDETKIQDHLVDGGMVVMKRVVGVQAEKDMQTMAKLVATRINGDKGMMLKMIIDLTESDVRKILIMIEKNERDGLDIRIMIHLLLEKSRQ